MFPLGLGVERVSSSSRWSRWHRVGAAVAVVLAIAASISTVAALDVATYELMTRDDVEVSASGRPFVRSFSVGTSVQQLAPLLGTATSGRCVVSTAATPLHIVNPNGVTPGEGPYCLDCAAGPSFSFPSSSVYVITTSGTATVGCSFFDGAQAVSTSGGAGGLSSTAGDARYLKLAADNDPLTSSLSVDQATNTTAVPTYTTASGRDLALAPAGGATGRGLVISSSLASSATDAVMLTGSAAAGVGRTSIAFVSSVVAAADRYVARFAASGGDVLRVSGTGALLPGASNDAQDIGAVGNSWARLFLGSSITGEANAKGLSISDVDAVSVTSGGKGITVQPTGAVVFNMESGTTWTSNLQLPGTVYTAAGGGVSAPPCSSSFPGRVVYVDRTGDGVRAEVCVCVATAADVYGYKKMDDLSVGCDVVP